MPIGYTVYLLLQLYHSLLQRVIVYSMKALHINTHANQINDLEIALVEKPRPIIGNNECLIKISASGINPSDALASIGYFNHAVLPRIPGRDYAGIVVEGPSHWIGKKVWGTGGAAGISFDGSHSEYMKLPVDALSLVPENLDLVTAAAQPLPYVTAYYSLVKRAKLKTHESVLVVGALGQVGRAAMSICQWQNCNAIAIVRGDKQYDEAIALGWNTINSEKLTELPLRQKILAANDGKPVHIILNSVGNFYWHDFINSLAEFGKIVTIGARENAREATINLFELYRANQEIIGVNTVSFGFNENACWLNELKQGFETNKLQALQVEPKNIYKPEHASKAYQEVLNGTSGKRIVIDFNEF